MSERSTVGTEAASAAWFADIAARVRTLEQRPQGAPNGLQLSGWAALPLAANWSALGGFVAPQYALDADRFVHLRGVAAKSIAVVNGETIGTIPAGARPLATILGMCWTGSNAGQNAARLDITAAGAVVFQTPNPAGASGWFVSLDSIAPFYSGA